MTPAAPVRTGTPPLWRAGIFASIVVVTVVAYQLSSVLNTRGQAAVGIVVFIALVAGCSSNLRAVNPRTIVSGILLQFLLACAVLYSEWVQAVLKVVGGGVVKLLEFSRAGSDFVFGPLADPAQLAKVFGPDHAFVFAFVALPPIIFVSGFFSLLYYFGVLQFLVKVMSVAMRYLMGTSGAETLSVSANVFMGQTEAPLIVKPFVPRMTQSELLALMASGMAHVSGGMMAVYIGYTKGYFGNDADKAAVAILTTCVMACPCSLYLTKLLLPETGTPETSGGAEIVVPKTHVNPIDALAGGIKDGLQLALNVAAMLIGFLAMIAMINALIGGIKPGLLWLWDLPGSGWLAIEAVVTVGFIASVGWTRIHPGDRAAKWYSIGLGLIAAIVLARRVAANSGFDLTSNLEWWPDDLTLEYILGWLFRPAAFLIGVHPDETGKVGTLLGIKLVANEHVAFIKLTKSPEFVDLGLRSRTLAVYALTGFANFASVGIQLGGIGALAPERRADLAKLGMRALFVGFLATLINAAVAGLLM